AFLHLLLIACCSQVTLAQEKMKLAFQDSVRVTLENNNGTTDAHAMGAVFATAWDKLSLDQQELIKDMAFILRRKKYKPFPLLNDFYGSIGFAVEKENADNEKITAFLKVAAQVVNSENGGRTAAFFRYSRDFFEYRALH